MRIYGMMTNRLYNPVGFALDRPRLSYKVDETDARGQEAARIRVASDPFMRQVLYDSGRSAQIDSLCHIPDMMLTPRTRYWWDVTVWADNGDTATSEPVYFETGKMDEPWEGRWISAPVDGNINLYKSFTLEKKPAHARVYAVGLGLYELYVNGTKAGNELLTPFCNAYDRWVQVQTYDVAPLLNQGENYIKVMLGDGWYKGRFGFCGETQLYGDTQGFLLEMRLLADDGREIVIWTDESWQAGESCVRFANIYDGEVYDAAFDDSRRIPAILCPSLEKTRLTDRLSPPVRVTQRLAPAAIITTPTGETVIDLGQEITGYLEFKNRAPKGRKLKLFYGEVLQNGCFCRDNLRSALQEYTYISDGTEAMARPYFTFYGFRYVKLEGFENPCLTDFCGCVVHSDIPVTASFICGSEKVNRLAQNVLWGQRGNFLDVPTDCPQRDERMGWTGDAQVFSGTACFQMESAAFYAKYLYDMRMEQEKLGGAVPYVVPMTFPGSASCAWSDAATIIPWNVFKFYGDKALLAAQYPLMRDWVEWIWRLDESRGGRRVWDEGFQYADWLALDTKDGTPAGGTDPYFIATAYYHYSTSLLAKAAAVLGHADDAARYEKLRQEIFDAFQREYFTPAGRLAQTTQTGYICALFLGLTKEENIPMLARLLETEFEQSQGKLRTGFVGTAYLCRTLSRIGLAGLTYNLFLNEEYPGWLYEVSMGATTVWERWNSILPDGSLSGTEMNSLNHYAYGAVMEWVFRDVAGINPVEESPGFRSALLRPLPDARLNSARAEYESAAGRYISGWSFGGTEFSWQIQVPFGAAARVVFPFAEKADLLLRYPELNLQEVKGEVSAMLHAGTYHFSYTISPPATH